ncbi:MAG: 16S rRNA (cytosine(1402)-N(4))-methyltransferase [Candidatus Nealsonbacteria bacterium CG_4_10_14_0_2_um_filter_38_17]|uniref:Ribosomal RNA small subunit methyltransferase H n=2 Tax=Candidatus Nealsoniibacteriota TaxID=1817911 RepID=A0A2M7UZ67_9BACT|nr:MAG: 16S rRNA (cytosine(1402)-N(4))-methyltransferase [Candidatus Nealsonbacteria bacterium CG23_combo_of_CG06-09_8_20_14_all_38_19]PIZ89240.1 MAG: 16S rRNA (cytosine(1402)-N(4))-methyltransferase [Candidatus Nealsonbacteria bacterium CG_4_10_14_0_2_um_filter_38_17]
MHIPVLQKEVLQYLDPGPNENFVDCTIDGGGHALSILEKTKPGGKLLGIDLDKSQISNLKSQISKWRLDGRLILANDNFADLKEIVKKNIFGNISGILLDLGYSSWHLEGSKRGFSFQKNEILDMRYNPESELSAYRIVNSWPKDSIEKILTEYGEEKFAKTISKNIVEERRKRPIKTTFDIVAVVKRSVPGWYQHKKIHFATRTFQALRIAVNDELNNLERTLPQALEIMMNGGKLLIISFHSLEDRIVKNFLRIKSKENKLKVLTKKPIKPSQEEIRINPRARSAKMRSAIKVK